MFILSITFMLPTVVFNFQPILRLILLNASTEFGAVDLSLFFDMLSSLGLQGTTPTGCFCSSSWHTFILSLALNVTGL